MLIISDNYIVLSKLCSLKVYLRFKVGIYPFWGLYKKNKWKDVKMKRFLIALGFWVSISLCVFLFLFLKNNALVLDFWIKFLIFIAILIFFPTSLLFAVLYDYLFLVDKKEKKVEVK